ncbi:MAG: DUF2064 domain-containing protein [Actinomycetia bacterium]|nr:DUF2064 domain-containing protein [Actinomycetes bacterium]
MTNYGVLVVAKAPVPGRVKTRLQPSFSAVEAAQLAGAALQDTMAVASGAAWLGVALDLSGLARVPRWIPGEVFPQVQGSLGARLDAAFAEARVRTELPIVLLGMDTPQVTQQNLADVVQGLADADFVLGRARDGGFWTLATAGPLPPVLAGVPMSASDTADRTCAALAAHGSVRFAATLEDVDDAASAARVARLVPDSAFGKSHARLLAGKAT